MYAIRSYYEKRVVILVTKEAHCLGDILIKSYEGALNVEIAAVVGNYDKLEDLANKFGVPFHHVSHEGLSREEHEAQMRAVIDGYTPDYVVLAKYMRVLTPEFVSAYPYRIINIHHSFRITSYNVCYTKLLRQRTGTLIEIGN